jgi:hypothetical protein
MNNAGEWLVELGRWQIPSFVLTTRKAANYAPWTRRDRMPKDDQNEKQKSTPPATEREKKKAWTGVIQGEIIVKDHVEIEPRRTTEPRSR